MKVFVSYARLNKDSAEALVRDLHALGHQAFYDRDLTGGQRWWDTLLDQVMNSDVFIPVLSDEYRESEACRAEAEWAGALDVPFLPVMVVPQLPGMYDPRIAEANWVSYDPLDRTALADLARAVGATQTTARPDPLPARPPIPLSYLVLVATEIRTSEDLGRQRQLAIVSNLRSKLGGREASGARELLAALRERPDVTFEVATTIDSLLAGHIDLEDVAQSPQLDGAASALPEPTTSPDLAATPLREVGGEEARDDVETTTTTAPPLADEVGAVQGPPPTLDSERLIPPREPDHPSVSESEGAARGSRLARRLVIVSGGLVVFAVTLAPWFSDADDMLDNWVYFSGFASYLEGFKLLRWVGAVLVLLLLTAVIAIAASTQVKPVSARVRVAACVINALTLILAFIHIRSDYWSVDFIRVSAGPFLLGLGLAALTVVLAKPDVGKRGGPA